VTTWTGDLLRDDCMGSFNLTELNVHHFILKTNVSLKAKNVQAIIDTRLYYVIKFVSDLGQVSGYLHQ
jgi:hypothetical protein